MAQCQRLAIRATGVKDEDFVKNKNKQLHRGEGKLHETHKHSILFSKTGFKSFCLEFL